MAAKAAADKPPTQVKTTKTENGSGGWQGGYRIDV